jgi:hypothetical protein
MAFRSAEKQSPQCDPVKNAAQGMNHRKAPSSSAENEDATSALPVNRVDSPETDMSSK